MDGKTLGLLLAVLGGFAPGAAAAQTPIWMLAQSLRARAQPFAFQRDAFAPGPSAFAPGAAFGAAADPGARCRAAIAAAERDHAIPPHLLGAIARVESGRRAPDGRVDPWPWSINVEGTDHVYDTQAQAIAAVRAFQAGGARSIDVGCLQVNLLYHPDAFATLEAAFDPVRNADYAAGFLTRLHAQTGSWETATAWYHSASPELGPEYQRRVTAVLPAEQRTAAPAGATQVAAPSVGPFMLGSRPQAARLLVAPAGSVGRTLAAYRAAPVLVAAARTR